MSNAALSLPPVMTVDEFLTWPGDGSGRIFELVDGEVRAQDPGSDAHGTIYATLPSVREVLIVHSVAVKAERLTCDPQSGWAANAAVFTGLAAVVPLGSIGLELPLAEAFRDTYHTG